MNPVQPPAPDPLGPPAQDHSPSHSLGTSPPRLSPRPWRRQVQEAPTFADPEILPMTRRPRTQSPANMPPRPPRPETPDPRHSPHPPGPATETPDAARESAPRTRTRHRGTSSREAKRSCGRPPSATTPAAAQRGKAGRARAAPGDRHRQPEGRRGQDHHHGQPRSRPGRDGATGSWSSTSIPRATPPRDWASRPATSSCPCTT